MNISRAYKYFIFYAITASLLCIIGITSVEGRTLLAIMGCYFVAILVGLVYIYFKIVDKVLISTYDLQTVVTDVKQVRKDFESQTDIRDQIIEMYAKMLQEKTGK